MGFFWLGGAEGPAILVEPLHIYWIYTKTTSDYIVGYSEIEY